jgi:hypothetical protein
MLPKSKIRALIVDAVIIVHDPVGPEGTSGEFSNRPRGYSGPSAKAGLVVSAKATGEPMKGSRRPGTPERLGAMIEQKRDPACEATKKVAVGCSERGCG